MSFGVFPNIEGVLFDMATLFGRLLDRLTRRNADEKENIRLLFSSLGLLESADGRINGFSGVAVIILGLRDRLGLISGSSEASCDGGTKPCWGRDVCTVHHISKST